MATEPLRLVDAPDVLTPPELARVLRIGRNAAYDLCHRVPGLARRSGSRWLIPKRAVERYLDNVEAAS